METVSNPSATKNKTSKNPETGHVKNSAHLQELISFCQRYGSPYNPSKELLTIPGLQNLYQRTQEQLDAVRSTRMAFDTARNNRRIEFKDFKSLSTKILNAFMVCGADAFAIDDLKTVNRKIQGKRAKKPKRTEEEEAAKTISVSQLSYNRLIDHFANAISILEQDSHYNPNENELKVSALRAKLEALKAVNKAVSYAYTQYSNAMISRNKTMYDPVTGMVQIAKEVKRYVKSIFGAASPEYRQISGIAFRVVGSK